VQLKGPLDGYGEESVFAFPVRFVEGRPLFFFLQRVLGYNPWHRSIVDPDRLCFLPSFLRRFELGLALSHVFSLNRRKEPAVPLSKGQIVQLIHLSPVCG